MKGEVPEKHIMRYPQFFATRAILKRLKAGNKRGIIWHTQGSGKTELSAYANKIIRDYYAKQNTVTRFFFVVDRLELLRQDISQQRIAITERILQSSYRQFCQRILVVMQWVNLWL